MSGRVNGLLPLAAGATVLLAVFTAPLVLGAYVVVQRAPRGLSVAWLWLLVVLLGVCLLTGALALALDVTQPLAAATAAG